MHPSPFFLSVFPSILFSGVRNGGHYVANYTFLVLSSYGFAFFFSFVRLSVTWGCFWLGHFTYISGCRQFVSVLC